MKKDYTKITKIIIPNIQDGDEQMIIDLCNYLDAHDWDYVAIKQEEDDEKERKI